MKMKQRLKSWVFWSSVAAQILSILVMTGTISTEISQVVDGVVVAVLQLFVVFGVLNNPTDSTSF